jgi:hypothetical protein
MKWLETSCIYDSGISECDSNSTRFLPKNHCGFHFEVPSISVNKRPYTGISSKRYIIRKGRLF